MMTKSFFRQGLLAVALLVSPLATRAASEFQGQIDMKMTAAKKPNEPVTFHYTIKEHKLRFELPTEEHSSRNKNATMAMVIDYDKKEMVTLMASTDSNGEVHKMAMRHALPEPKPVDPKAAAQPANGETPHVPVATGRTEEILGYKASEYTMTEKNGDLIQMWMAKGLGSFMSPNGQGMGMRSRHSAAESAEWEKFARDSGSFPLRVVGQKKTGEEQFRMEVTKIDKSPVDDSVFSTEGYQEIQMPSFGGKDIMNGLFGH